MKIFGIGLTGYIGAVVSEHLQRAGHTLVGLARSKEAEAELNARNIDAIPGKLGDIEAIMQAARHADGVIGLATGGFLTSALADGVAHNYLSTVAAIMDALEGTGKPYIQVSGTGFWLGNALENPGRVLTEDIDPHPPYFYAANLPVGRALRASKERGVRGIVLAPAQVYGREGGYIGPVARRFDCIRKFGAMYMLPPSACGEVTYVHVDDFASLVSLAFEKADAGEVLFAAADTVPTFELARAVSRVCGLKGRVDVLPEHVLAAAAGPVHVSDCKSKLLASGERARRVLGWSPQQLCLLDEMASLEGKTDFRNIYPGVSRQAMAATVKL